jgi:hypothetical protein
MSISPTPSDGSDSSISLSAIDDPTQQLGQLSPNFDKYHVDSDLILRSSDNVLFPIHRARLAGSSVFRDMFEISGGSEEELGQSYGNDTPVLQLAESSMTLETILPFFYDQLPEVDDMEFETIFDAFEASLKYGMTLVEHILTARLR